MIIKMINFDHFWFFRLHFKHSLKKVFEQFKIFLLPAAINVFVFIGLNIAADNRSSCCDTIPAIVSASLLME